MQTQTLEHGVERKDVFSGRRSPTSTTIYEWSGPDPLRVVLAVNKYLADNYKQTQCYEHMRPYINKAQIIDGKLTITTCKSNYAGD